MHAIREYVIRQATPSDIVALRIHIERSVRELQKSAYSPDQIEGALGHALGLDTQLIEDGTYFIAHPRAGSGDIAGCGGWSFRSTLFGSDHGPGRKDDLLDPATAAAKIRAFFVSPDHVRRRVGSMILEYCECAARAAGFRKLEMGSTLTGVPLYRERGYKEGKRIEVPLPNGATLPIVLMAKQLL